MTLISTHTLRADAGMFGSFTPSGWNPRLTVGLQGPTPTDSELIWTVSRPDGTPWFEHRTAAPDLEAGEATTVTLQRWEEGGDIAEAGEVAYRIRLVAVLDGIDEVLGEGTLRALPLDGEQRYAIDNRALDRTALISLDAVEEHDAPRLKVSVFVNGEVDLYNITAHCYRDGTRVGEASDVDVLHSFTANDGATVGIEAEAVFDDIRGWNNLADSGWGGHWHLLDAHDGSYEVTFLHDSTIVRAVAFTVSGGRIEGASSVEPDPRTGWVMTFGATADDNTDSVSEISPWRFTPTGSVATAATLDDVYRSRTAPAAAADDDDGQLDPASAAVLDAFIARAERLIHSWEADIVGALPPFSPEQVSGAEAVRAERPGYETVRDAASTLPDIRTAAIYGEPTTLGDMRARMQAILDAADAMIAHAASAHADERDRYRALLSGDKLAVFDEHPADAFQYTTTDGRIIETPEEIAEAEFWYFEGPIEFPTTAVVDGTPIRVAVQGWRLLGWRFDVDGNTIDEWELQGQGINAPKSAYRRE